VRIMAVSHPCVMDVNQQFYAELEGLGHQVHLIVPSNFHTEYAPAKVARWPAFGGTIEQRRIGLRRSVPLHFYSSNLRPQIAKFAPDVLFVEEEPYSASAWQAFYASRGLPMKRIVYSAQNICKTYPRPFRWMERYVLSNADMAAVVSQEVGAVMRRKQFGGKLLPFPLGVDTGQFRPLPAQRRRLRAELGIGDERFVVGYVGRFVEEKGVRTLIEAARRLTDATFVFVGSGALQDELRRAAALDRGRVIVKDAVKHREVHTWMNAFDALALPSLTMPAWKEQFGRVVIEAMACRVPVIGSDSGEIPALIRETGGGWTFPEGDAEALAQRIRSLAADESEREAAAERGYESVRARFSKRALAEAFDREIRSAAGGSGR